MGVLLHDGVADSYEPNDQAFNSTSLEGTLELAGGFDGATDVDWFDYRFTESVTKLRIYFSGNATMTLYSVGSGDSLNEIGQIASGTAGIITGDPNSIFYMKIAQSPSPSTSLILPMVNFINWEVSLTGVPSDMVSIYYGSNESITGLIDYRPQVYREMTVSGFVLDDTGRVVPNTGVRATLTLGVPDQIVNTGPSGNFLINFELPKCTGNDHKMRYDRVNKMWWLINANENQQLQLRLSEQLSFSPIFEYHHICLETTQPLAKDADNDRVLFPIFGLGAEDLIDNCPNNWNPWQEDWDGDNVGDACDNFPTDSTRS